MIEPHRELGCEHDLDVPIHQGRAHYICRLCGEDITLALVLLWELDNVHATEVEK